MITLTLDPHSEVPPDFRTNEHRFTREAFAHGREGMSEDQAAEALSDLWLAGLERRKATWEAEREERKAEGRADRGHNREDAPGRAIYDVTLSGERGERPEPSGWNACV